MSNYWDLLVHNISNKTPHILTKSSYQFFMLKDFSCNSKDEILTIYTELRPKMNDYFEFNSELILKYSVPSNSPELINYFALNKMSNVINIMNIYSTFKKYKKIHIKVKRDFLSYHFRMYWKLHLGNEITNMEFRQYFELKRQCLK